MISLFSVYADGEYQAYFTSHFQSRDTAKRKARAHADGLKRWRLLAADAKIEIRETKIEQEEI